MVDSLLAVNKKASIRKNTNNETLISNTLKALHFIYNYISVEIDPNFDLIKNEIWRRSSIYH